MIRDYVVADASVLLKWYLHDNEPSRHQAMLLYDRFVTGELRIVLPEVAVYELGNRLVRVPRYGLALFSDALELLTDIFPLESGELKDLAARVAELHSHGFKKVTVYDGAYLYIAGLIDGPLITADALQANAARALGIRVISLEDYR